MRLRRSAEVKAARVARRRADYMLWHDGYPNWMLADGPDGPEGAVVVAPQPCGWVVYRKRGSAAEGRTMHDDATEAYREALERVYKICNAESIGRDDPAP